MSISFHETKPFDRRDTDAAIAVSRASRAVLGRALPAGEPPLKTTCKTMRRRGAGGRVSC
ncbi:hypothetical protein ASG54_14560 [Aureimonas sp. Leaf460]|nr:hypothetical protein ASG62_01660 [Aureimonas sp. Leaf427]KQT76009.1 hypothetical protein ASG54_14560 [Aureimonas sp. Leaf460]